MQQKAQTCLTLLPKNWDPEEGWVLKLDKRWITVKLTVAANNDR
jgi:hypothetical protein